MQQIHNGAIDSKETFLSKANWRIFEVVCNKDLTGGIFAGVGVDDGVVEPHMGNSHPVLGQGPRLIWADGRRRTKSLDGFQVLDETVLDGHPLSGQGQAHLWRNSASRVEK